MELKDISFEFPEENILFDEVLLDLAEQGEGAEVLRFWESPQIFIVLGRISHPAEDLKINAVLQDQIPVLRRFSGGGTVVQGKGCLNYTLILSKEKNSQIATIHQSYQYILGKVILALKQAGVEALFKPTSDIAMPSIENDLEKAKKISGNAQKRGKKYILHHGTILYNFDLSLIEKYLTIPKKIPEYRGCRSHEEFIRNIPCPLGPFKKAMGNIFEIDHVANTIESKEKIWLESLKRDKKVSVTSKELAQMLSEL